jgi:hypothetical protein
MSWRSGAWTAARSWSSVAPRFPAAFERVNLAGRRRALFKEFAATDRAGLLSVREIFVTDDLRSYSYTGYYQLSSLFESEAQP